MSPLKLSLPLAAFFSVTTHATFIIEDLGSPGIITCASLLDPSENSHRLHITKNLDLLSHELTQIARSRMIAKKLRVIPKFQRPPSTPPERKSNRFSRAAISRLRIDPGSFDSSYYLSDYQMSQSFKRLEVIGAAAQNPAIARDVIFAHLVKSEQEIGAYVRERQSLRCHVDLETQSEEERLARSAMNESSQAWYDEEVRKRSRIPILGYPKNLWHQLADAQIPAVDHAVQSFEMAVLQVVKNRITRDDFSQLGVSYLLPRMAVRALFLRELGQTSNYAVVNVARYKPLPSDGRPNEEFVKVDVDVFLYKDNGGAKLVTTVIIDHKLL